MQELLLRDQALCLLFRYDGSGDRMEYLGQAQGEVVGVMGSELAAHAEGGWTLYTKCRGALNSSFFTNFSEEYTSLIGWVTPQALASGLL